MNDLDITRHEGESFRDFHARAATERALYEQNLTRSRDVALATVLRVAPHDILNVIVLGSAGDADADAVGSYVVEINFRFGQKVEQMWTTAVGGKSDSTLFYDRRRAILHALGRETDMDINSARLLVEAAARVLNLPDENAN